MLVLIRLNAAKQLSHWSGILAWNFLLLYECAAFFQHLKSVVLAKPKNEMGVGNHFWLASHWHLCLCEWLASSFFLEYCMHFSAASCGLWAAKGSSLPD